MTEAFLSTEKSHLDMAKAHHQFIDNSTYQKAWESHEFCIEHSVKTNHSELHYLVYVAVAENGERMPIVAEGEVDGGQLRGVGVTIGACAVLRPGITIE